MVFEGGKNNRVSFHSSLNECKDSFFLYLCITRKHYKGLIE